MKIAVLAGSFDPVTNGHLNLIKRASRLCDCLYVVVGINLNKHYLFSTKQRVQFIKDNLKNYPQIKVASYQGLIVNFMKSHHAKFLIRGVRDSKDFDFERSLAQMNHHLAPGTETVLLLTSPQETCVSSHAVKEVNHFGGDISDYVPKNVEQALLKFRK